MKKIWGNPVLYAMVQGKLQENVLILCRSDGNSSCIELIDDGEEVYEFLLEEIANS